MKIIKVIMRPENTFKLKDALHELGYHGITTKESLGYGEQKSVIKKIYRGQVFEERSETTKRVELEFVVSDKNTEKVIETIRNVAKTDQGGDGRIYISTLDDAIHIHSGDKHLGDNREEGLSTDKLP